MSPRGVTVTGPAALERAAVRSALLVGRRSCQSCAPLR